jgi:hypothetical protein
MDIYLDGGEIAIVKAIGIGGGVATGDTLMDRTQNMDIHEVIDVLKGLMTTGYVICDRDTFRDNDDFRNAEFHVNSGYTKALKLAVNPEPQSKKSRRIRRE